MNYDQLNVRRYDADRKIPEAAMQKIVSTLLLRFPPSTYTKVLDAGVGTGRWAIPLDLQDYEVFGVDVSSKMLSELRGKQTVADSNVLFAIAAVEDLPSANDSFDLCIISHLFHLVKCIDSVANELSRVLRSHAGIVHIKSGKGMSIPWLTKLYIEKIETMGIEIAHFSSSTDIAFDAIHNFGFQTHTIDQIEWTQKVQIKQGIEVLENRSFSITSKLDEGIHMKVVQELKDQMVAEYGSLAVNITVPNTAVISAFVR
jgi:ubiquinone/menaquinone biosynthesis C-methylase UbiE